MTMVDGHATGRRDLADIMAELGHGPEGLATGEGWSQMLGVQARCRGLSFQNRLLVWCQRPDATELAGWRQWAARGRPVRAGETAVSVMVPTPDGYGWGKVFDVSQTEGDPPPPGHPAPGPLARLLAASIDGRHVNGVVTTDDRSHGCWSPTWGEVNLVEGPEPQMVAALLHGLGHVYDHASSLDLDRGPGELVAESVACVLGGEGDPGVFGRAFDGRSWWRDDAGWLLWLAQRVDVAVARIRAQWAFADPALVTGAQLVYDQSVRTRR